MRYPGNPCRATALVAGLALVAGGAVAQTSAPQGTADAAATTATASEPAAVAPEARPGGSREIALGAGIGVVVGLVVVFILLSSASD